MASRRELRERRSGSPADSSLVVQGPSHALRPLHYLLVAMVAVAGLLAYANCQKGVFVFDDDMWVTTEKPYKRRPIVAWTLRWNRSAAPINAANGEPDPAGYHRFNLAVHVLASLALFGVVRRTLLTPRLRERCADIAPWFAFAVALLWVVHPLQTQSVMYIIQRGQSMMGLFYLLTLYCVLRGAAAPHVEWLWYAGAIVACALGMGCKEDMVTAPVLVAVFDFVFLEGTIREKFRRRWPLYAGLFATLIVLFVVGAGNVLKTNHKGPATVGLSFKGVSGPGYLMTQAAVIVHYLRLSFWPDKLCLDYAWPYAKALGDMVSQGALLLVLLAGSVYGVIRRHPLGFVGVAFFVILAPTSSVIPIRDAAVEHRMYLPLAAVIVGVVAGVFVLSKRVPRGASGVVMLAAAVVLSVPLAMRTFARNKDYHDDREIWRTVIAIVPENARAHYNLGKELGEEAVRLKASADPAVNAQGQALAMEAIECYKTALEFDPDHVSANNNMGMELAKSGKPAEAEPYFRAVVRLDRRHAFARNNLGMVLSDLGRHEEALPWFADSLRVSPGNAEAYFNWGLVLNRMNRNAEAAEKYRKTLELRPGHAKAQSLLQKIERATQGDP